MKNRNGYTLVEVLAVISILGVVMILLVPTMLSTFYSAKGMLDDYVVDDIKDAAKMWITDYDLGVYKYTYNGADTTINGKTYKKGDVMDTYDFKVYVIENKGVNVSVKELVDGGYYDDDCKYAGSKVSVIEDGVEKTKVLEKDQNCEAPKECIVKVSIDSKKVENDKYYVTNGYTAELFDGCK